MAKVISKTFRRGYPGQAIL